MYLLVSDGSVSDMTADHKTVVLTPQIPKTGLIKVNNEMTAEKAYLKQELQAQTFPYYYHI